MSICEIVRARAAAHSSVLRMALDDVGRALLRVGTVARNTRLLRRSYRVFRRVSRVGVLLVPRRACDGWASSIISYRMSHTIVHGIRAQHTRRRYRVAYPISELFRTLPPLRCTSPSESLSYRMLHTIVSDVVSNVTHKFARHTRTTRVATQSCHISDSQTLFSLRSP